ncbi:MAG: glucosamine 6-phosphate synthetase [Chloroflexi bacterium]|nr:glucosamine 6-phosphate synthetase [Chloroflexota bacterium]
MCGIFGVITSKQSKYSKEFLTKSLKHLALLSETRGKDSSGLCTFNQVENRIEVLKGPIPIRQLFYKKEIKNVVSSTFSTKESAKYAFGHSRLVTNGTQLDDANNQPVIKEGIVGVHNGIVVNVDELWERHPNINRENEIDTEVLLALIRLELKNNKSVKEAVSKSINKIFGTVSTALVFEDLDEFILATNNGSLYILYNNKDILFFASERSMLSEFEKKINLSEIGKYQIKHIKCNNGISISLSEYKIQNFSLKTNNNEKELSRKKEKYKIELTNIISKNKQLSTVLDLNLIHLNTNATREQALLQYPIDKIKTLKRCTKCILPETFPFIEFDDKGECNYCKNHKRKNQPKTIKELQDLVKPYRKANNKPEVLIPFSGGRDSTYVLHMVKKELGLNAVTYTYDWGMVTDLARRNVARICGKLGVENIIVAADIHWKRQNIKKNITAWLKNPTLGMIPLFMAGDKFFFYYAYKIKKQLDIDLEIWGVNYLENTEFKTGFAGLAPQFDKKRIYSISLMNQLKLFGFVAKNMLQSPGYINQSVLDSLGSFASRYLTPKTDYYHMFDYTSWNEKVIEDTIINNYDWEKAIDTKSTWRIGDGTASFYNYIYTLTVGFSENDTFRSNQIREGMITRERALELIYDENKPRYNSLKWYMEIIGLDFVDVIKIVNKIPRLY